MFEDDRVTDHLLFLHLMLDYTEQERKVQFHTMGYRQDTELNADSASTTQDEMCQCDCGRCICNLIFLSGTGSGLCGVKGYDDILTDGKKLTAAEVKATLLKKKAFNKGERF